MLEDILDEAEVLELTALVVVAGDVVVVLDVVVAGVKTIKIGSRCLYRTRAVAVHPSPSFTSSGYWPSGPTRTPSELAVVLPISLMAFTVT